MPKIITPLTAAQVKALRKRPGTYNVGGAPGLLLQVTQHGAASWILRATMSGRVRSMGLGSFYKVGLEQARAAAREAHAAIAQGRDPIQERAAHKRSERKQAVKSDKIITFKEAAKRFHREVKSEELRNAKARAEWLRTLELHTFDLIGDLPVREIGHDDVMAVLKPLWPRPVGQALRASIQAVLDWSRVGGYRDTDNPALWTTLRFVLPKPGRAYKGGHHAAIPWPEVPAFLSDLRQVGTVAAKAYEFAILTAARSNEVRQATWAEIDLGAKLWTLPPERMKAGKAHRVPLSEPAVKLLESLPHREGLLFIGGKRKPRALFDYELSYIKLSRETTPHGTARSCFKDWARSLGTRFTDEASELALAHVDSDSTRSAYARDELLPERTRLMNEWGQFVASGRAPVATVTKIRAG